MPQLTPVANPETRKSDSKLSRREFARRAALAATTAAVMPAVLLSQETAPKPAPTAAPPQSSPPLSPELKAEGELKYQWIIQNYGSRLTEAEKKDVYRLVMEGQKPLAAFRSFPLENSDQPATVLKFTDTEMQATKGRP